jgi:dipeptidase E
MPTRLSQIVAFGGGGFSIESHNTCLDDHVLSLTGVARPRVCFLPTASGDADHYIVRFYRAFSAARCEPSHVTLFRRETGIVDPRRHLLEQDLIYVGGGSVVSLLAVWCAHGLDLALRQAWEDGVVLCGGSAGSLCWFAEAVSGFHGGEGRRVQGLGLLPWSNAVHYGEPGRRAGYHDCVAGGMRAGYAATDGAALHFLGDELAEVVASRDDAHAYFVAAESEEVIERELPIRQLRPREPSVDGDGSQITAVAA